MDSKHGGVPVSATKATPSPPEAEEVYPKVSLSTSSPGFSIPIRAPPTVDSDVEYSLSTNGRENHDSSCSISENGFESGGFLSGEDEFEAASDRAFFADPDDETPGESRVVEEYVVSRPFVTNPYEENREESGSVEDYVVSRAFVRDPYGVNREESDSEDDYAVSRAFVIDTDKETSVTPIGDVGISLLGKVGVPIAMLSRDSDDDSVGTEVVDEDGFSVPVRVPGIHLLGRSDSAIKVKGFGVEGEEEKDESQFEPALEAEVEGSIAVKYPVSDERVKDEVLDVEEATVQSFVVKKDDFLCGNLEMNEEIELIDCRAEKNDDILCENFKMNEESELVNCKAEVDADDKNSESKGVDVSESFIHDWGCDKEKTKGINERRNDLGVRVHDCVACSSVEPVESVIAGNGIQIEDGTSFSELYPVQETVCYGSGLSPGTAGNIVTEDTQSIGLNLDSELLVKAEVEDKTCHDSENSGAYSEDELKSSTFGISDTTNLIVDGLEQSLTPTSLGEISQDLLPRTESPIIVASNEEVDTDGKSEGKKLFDSRVFSLEEGEEDELEFELALEDEVEGFIAMKYSVSDEKVKEEVPDDAEQATVESFVAKKDDFLSENLEMNEESELISCRAEVGVDYQNSKGVHDWGSDDEKTKGINERIIDLGVEVHDFVSCSGMAMVFQNEDGTSFSEPYPGQETKWYGNGLSPGTAEIIVTEDAQSLGFILDSELEVKAEVEDKTRHDSENSGGGSYSEDNAKSSIFGILDTTNLIVDGLEQSLTPTSLGESSQDLIPRTGRPIIVASNEEVDTNGKSEGRELFDSRVFSLEGGGGEEESEFEPALEDEVEGSIAMKYSASDEKVKHEVPDDAEEATVESLVAKKDDFLFENLGMNEERELMNCRAEVDVDYQNSESKGVDVSESVIHDSGSDDDITERVNDQIIDLGVEVHDFVACSGVLPVDSVVAGNGIQNGGSICFAKPYPGQERWGYGISLSPGTADNIVTEDGFHCKTDTQDTQQSHGFSSESSDSEFEVKAEVEDKAGHDSENSGGGSYSEDDLKAEVEDKTGHDSENSGGGSYSADDPKSSTFGISDTTNLVADGLEQSLTPTSLGEISRDLLPRTERPSVVVSNEEVDRDGKSEGKELFGSSVLTALLKAASGGASGGGSFTVTSANISRALSLENPTNSELATKSGGESEENQNEEEKKKLEKIQLIRVKFLRLVQRLGRSCEDSIAAQVLHRLVLVAGRPSSRTFSFESAKRTAMQLEAEGGNDLDFSLNILVLGKTGVGKSATINSIFGEKKAVVDAFEPATTVVKDIAGTVDGIKVRIFDTPGLRSSLMEQAYNRKILLSIRKLTRKFPPDVVLYVDRLDTQTSDLNDLPLLRSITSLLGSSIWHNSIVTLTHAASSPPDWPSGSPLRYDLFVAQRSRGIQQSISQAAGDLGIMSPPVSLVENHSSCQKREDGQLVLPNGESWRPQLLLLCYSMKISSEANAEVKTRHPFYHRKIFGFMARSPPLPYFLSSLLQSNAHPKLPSDQSGDNVESDTKLGDFSDCDQRDEDEDEKSGNPSAVDVPLPDMALPPSFDGDNPAYRYRFLQPTSQTRPVLDLHGWDHDCGYDGVSLESSLSVAGHLPAVLAVQITKDKKYFNIHLDSSIAAKHGESGSTMAGLDIRTVGNQLASCLKGETKAKTCKTNETAAGVSVTFLGETVATGLKLEDQIRVGKRLVLVGSTGIIRSSQGDTSFGVNLEARLREEDLPTGQQDQTAMSLSLTRWRGELTWVGNLQSQFSIGRDSKVVVRAGLNSKLTGQVAVRISSSDQLQIALVGILPIANAIFRTIFPDPVKRT